MRLKLDENIAMAVVAALTEIGHDVEHVKTEGLAGHPDGDIWAAAQEEQRLLVTQDVKFADARMFRTGEHHGLLLLRIEDATIAKQVRLLRRLFVSEEAQSWAGCLVVATPQRVRVRRPRPTSSPSSPDTP